MLVLSGGDAANDNRSIRATDRLCPRLDLVPDAWSSTPPPVEMVAWIEAARCSPVEICPVPDPRQMPTSPN